LDYSDPSVTSASVRLRDETRDGLESVELFITSASGRPLMATGFINRRKKPD
jgi:hypothetical protein